MFFGFLLLKMAKRYEGSVEVPSEGDLGIINRTVSNSSCNNSSKIENSEKLRNSSSSTASRSSREVDCVCSDLEDEFLTSGGDNLRPRSKVINRPRVTIHISDEEVDSDDDWSIISSSVVSAKNSRNSVINELSEKATNHIRSIVSGRKKRFTIGSYDLDLSYVMNNIIAMGYPSEGAEAYYRNKMSTVQSFLEEFHRGHYKVFNLCSEKVYPATKFRNRVGYYAFDDHKPPSLPLMWSFCSDVQHWLNGSPKNVAVIHCKAGKGRTGCMVCAYLVFAKLCKTAGDALEFFGAQRTHDGKGVTIPSQIRYVRYTEQIVHSDKLSFHMPTHRVLTQVVMVTIPTFDSTGGCNPYFIVNCNGDDICSTKKTEESIPKCRPSRQAEVTWNCSIPVYDDVYIEFWDFDRYSTDSVMFGIAFHAAFIGEDCTLVFKREEIDRAHKKKKTFTNKFMIKLQFAK